MAEEIAEAEPLIQRFKQSLSLVSHPRLQAEVVKDNSNNSNLASIDAFEENDTAELPHHFEMSMIDEFENSGTAQELNSSLQNLEELLQPLLSHIQQSQQQEEDLPLPQQDGDLETLVAILDSEADSSEDEDHLNPVNHHNQPQIDSTEFEQPSTTTMHAEAIGLALFQVGVSEKERAWQNSPIHALSTITCLELLLTLMIVFTTARIPNTLRGLILMLLHAVCPPGNYVPRTLDIFRRHLREISHLCRKYFVFHSSQILLLVIHIGFSLFLLRFRRKYYCDTCVLNVDESKQEEIYSKFGKQHTTKFLCSKCGAQCTKYFLFRPWDEIIAEKTSQSQWRQLTQYYAVELLNKPRDCDAIHDIYDGRCYDSVRPIIATSPSNAYNITLLRNTDGVKPFKWSNYHFWPFLLVVNEMSPVDR